MSLASRPGPARLLLEGHPLSTLSRRPLSFITTPWGEPRGEGQELPPSPYLSFVLPAFGGRGTCEVRQGPLSREQPSATIYLQRFLHRGFPKDSQGVPHPVSDIPNDRLILPLPGAGMPLSFAYFSLRTVRVHVGGLRIMSIDE